MVTERAKNAQIGDEAAAGTNQRDGFFCGEVAGLVQGVIHGKFVAGAKELFEMLAAEMNVTSGGVDGEGGGRTLCEGFEALEYDTADDLLDVVAVNGELSCRLGHTFLVAEPGKSPHLAETPLG